MICKGNVWFAPGWRGISACRSIWFVDCHGYVLAIGLVCDRLRLDRLVSSVPLSLN